MADNTNFKPRRVTDSNDQKDEKSNLCIRGLLVDSQAIAHEIKCHRITGTVHDSSTQI